MRDWLAAAAEKSPDATALIEVVRSEYGTNYRYLSFWIAQFAAQLTLAGVRQGDYVGTLLNPMWASVALIHALVRLGAILVPLNLRLTSDELHDQVESTHCKAIICDPANVPNATRLRSSECSVYNIFGEIFDESGRKEVSALPTPEMTSWLDFRDGEIDLDAVQSIVFTSGTTGTPKGAQITFGNLYHSALASAERLGASPDDRWLCPLPFYHVGGLSIIFRSAIYGSSIVLPEATNAEGIINALYDSQATIVSLVPTQLYRILDAGFEPPPSLRLILVGGAVASPELVQRCIQRNLPVSLTYGLTEAASQVATATPEQVRAKPGSVGKPLAGTTVRIVDDEGYDQPPETYGEIVVSGDTVMRGYLGQPPTNGAFHTGDIGYLDTDGDLWVVQRRSDLIVSGGENVYPAEVEAALREHPAVEDACVVGVSDTEWGQRVAAMVALKPGMILGEADLLAFSRERLAGYKQPRTIVFVDELPQTASGKVQRQKVREYLAVSG